MIRLLHTLLLVVSSSIYTIQQKAACHPKQADIIFLLDSSGSVGDANFQIEKKFILNFTKAVHIGPADVQVGVVKYAFTPKTEIKLKDSNNASYVEAVLNKIVFEAGSTRTDKALKYVLESEFQPIKGNRSSAPDYVVVLTDGMSFYGQSTYYQAIQLHNAGVTVYAVGIGSNINKTELSRIATDERHMFVVPDYNALHEIQNDLHPIACNNVAPSTTQAPIYSLPLNPCTSSPCRFGKCYHDISNYVCICQQGYHGKNCDQDLCSGMPCKNGGKCYHNANDYVCICNGGFSGRNCENAPTARPGFCTSRPCVNGGQCFEDEVQFICICPPGFTGTTCSDGQTTSTPATTTTSWFNIPQNGVGKR